MKRFLDTFALVEIERGNRAYRGFHEDAATGVLNLLELHVALCRLGDKAEADLAFRSLRSAAVDATDEELLAASAFKRAHPRIKYSYADALGYAIARSRGWPFVTGDRAFKGVEGVEFVAGR